MTEVVLITGGSLGIGKAIANEFVRQNATVIICSRTRKDLDRAAAEMNCDSMAADVSDAEQVKKLFEYIRKKCGTLDVLVNCAGVYGPIGPLETNDDSAWKNTIGINLIGTVNCIKHAIPLMKARKSGKIINMAGGGIGGKNLQPNFTAYLASKAAVVVLTEAVAKELKDFNIQVNAISPGPVNTRFLDRVLEAGVAAGKDYLEKARKQKEEGGTQPEKAAALALYLASDRCSFTGKTISAVWDDYKNFSSLSDSMYAFRRIDDVMFREVNNRN
ncbi:SDR family oxidoreductase [Candidatus Woesearchaeota archaeon]|nr:SDR family oxidoreductase [Candidatus Woesearchaeota archaeon]